VYVQVSNMFIVSLAIADLLVGLLVMPISAAYIMLEHWRFGIVVCQLWIGMDYIASTASILNLLILSMDRYWSVSSPLKYLRYVTEAMC
jgi:histamine receptor H1